MNTAMWLLIRHFPARAILAPALGDETSGLIPQHLLIQLR